MPYVRPTLEQINDRIQADIKAKMGSQATFLRRSWIGVFGRVLAGACHLLYGYIAHSIRQFFVVSADEDSIVRKASLYGINRIPASLASGAVSFKGTTGVNVPTGTVVLRSDGTRYVTTVDVELTGASEGTSIPIRAIDPGKSGNMQVGETLTLESPRAGVDEFQTVTTSVSNGADLEPIDSLVTRYTNRIQNIPQGGAKGDYYQWAKELPNIGQVIVYTPGEISLIRKSNDFVPPIGEVWVYFSERGTVVQPSTTRVKAMQDYLDIRKPVTATVRAFGIKERIIPFNIKIKIADGLAPLTALAQAKTDAMNALIDLLDEQAIPTSTVFLSQINEAISRSNSEIDHVLITPSSNVVMGIDEIGKLDPINAFTVTPKLD